MITAMPKPVNIMIPWLLPAAGFSQKSRQRHGEERHDFLTLHREFVEE
jgi:hypothetical protein